MNLPAPLRSLITWIRGGQSAFVPTQADRGLTAFLDSLNFSRLKRALSEWTLGNPREIGLVFEQLRRLPLLKGVTRQALTAVKAVEFEVHPPAADGLDPARAQASADLFAAVWKRISGPFIETVVRIGWEGGGYYEPTWVEDEKGRVVPTGVSKVALQRVRRDKDTGKLTFAKESFDWVGVPLDEYPPGVFFEVDPERDVQDFACRGEFVAAITDLWRLREILGFWAQDVEQSESPTAHMKAGNESDRKIFVAAAGTWGNGGRVVTSTDSEITLVQKQNRSAYEPHDLYEQRAKARMALVFLGSEQTVSIAPDAGSKQSATVHQAVADDAMRETCGRVENAANALARFIALMNEGDERYGATVSADLDDEPNAVVILSKFQAAKNLGVETSEDQLREETGLRKPGKGEAAIPASAVTPMQGGGPIGIAVAA